MERPMDSWNDDRLDELSRRVDEGFKEMREGFARVDRDMKEGFARVDQRFNEVAPRKETEDVIGEIRAECRLIHEKLDRLTHALMVVGLSFGITMFAALGGVIATQA